MRKVKNAQLKYDNSNINSNVYGITYKFYNLKHYKNTELTKNLSRISKIQLPSGKQYWIKQMHYCKVSKKYINLYSLLLDIHLLKYSYNQVLATPHNFWFDRKLKQYLIKSSNLDWFNALMNLLTKPNITFKSKPTIYVTKQLNDIYLTRLQSLVLKKALENILREVYSKESSIEGLYSTSELNVDHVIFKIRKKLNNSLWALTFKNQFITNNLTNKKIQNLLEKRIRDKNFVNILIKLSNNHSMDDNFDKVSSVLCNLYYLQLDQYMLYLHKEYNLVLHESTINVRFPEINNLIINALVFLSIKKYKQILFDNLKQVNAKNKYSLIHYARYLDKFLISIKGSKKVVFLIKRQMLSFFKSSFKINLKQTQLIYLLTNQCHFLGFCFEKKIFLVNNIKKERHQQKLKKLKIKTWFKNFESINKWKMPIVEKIKYLPFKMWSKLLQINHLVNLKQKLFSNLKKPSVANSNASLKQKRVLKILIPLKKIKRNLRFFGIVNKNDKPSAINKLLLCYTEEIIIWYNALAYGLLKYYKNCSNYDKLCVYINYFFRWSLLHTLAKKHKKPLNKIIFKYSKDIKIKSTTTHKIITQLFTLKLTKAFKLKQKNKGTFLPGINYVYEYN